MARFRRVARFDVTGQVVALCLRQVRATGVGSVRTVQAYCRDSLGEWAVPERAVPLREIWLYLWLCQRLNMYPSRR
jgi:hypothetical protein